MHVNPTPLLVGSWSSDSTLAVPGCGFCKHRAHWILALATARRPCPAYSDQTSLSLAFQLEAATPCTLPAPFLHQLSAETKAQQATYPPQAPGPVCILLPTTPPSLPVTHTCGSAEPRGSWFPENSLPQQHRCQVPSDPCRVHSKQQPLLLCKAPPPRKAVYLQSCVQQGVARVTGVMGNSEPTGAHQTGS